jgi:hypothetical protein
MSSQYQLALVLICLLENDMCHVAFWLCNTKPNFIYGSRAYSQSNSQISQFNITVTLTFAPLWWSKSKWHLVGVMMHFSGLYLYWPMPTWTSELHTCQSFYFNCQHLAVDSQWMSLCSLARWYNCSHLSLLSFITNMGWWFIPEYPRQHPGDGPLCYWVDLW